MCYVVCVVGLVCLVLLCYGDCVILVVGCLDFGLLVAL